VKLLNFFYINHIIRQSIAKHVIKTILYYFLQPRTGLLAILDEVSNFTQGSDRDFTLRIKKDFKDHPKFVSHGADTMFAIKHFAATVDFFLL